jgi:hypothetical protein
MKIKISYSDRFIYIIFCLLSFGAVWIMRVIISEGIRMALDEKK